MSKSILQYMMVRHKILIVVAFLHCKVIVANIVKKILGDTFCM